MKPGFARVGSVESGFGSNRMGSVCLTAKENGDTFKCFFAEDNKATRDSKCLY